MRADPSSVTTSNSVPAEFGYRGGEFGELVIIYNPATNTNRIWAALNRDATVAGVTGQTCIAPGQYAFFILTQEDNRSGINVIAETGTTVVTVQRQSFRSRLELVAVMGGLYGGAVAGQYWVAVSGTAIKLAGAYTEAQADTLRAKTTNSAMTLAKNGTGGLILGNSGLALDNPADTLVGTGTTGIEFSSTQHVAKVSGTTKMLLASTELQAHAIGVTVYAGAGSDPRISMLPSGTPRLTLNLPAAGGASSTTFLCVELPIKSGSVVAPGDMVCYDFSGQNRVRTATATADHVKGKAVTGGTGNAGGTVTSIIIVSGVEVNAFTVDTAGVTAGQYLVPGAVTATKVQSQATIPASFAKALTTAVLNALTDVQYFDSM